MEYINVDDVFISFARQESVNRNQNNMATFTLYRITFGEDTTSIRYVTLHLRDRRGTASLRLTEIAPKSPSLCVNWFSCRRKSYTVQCEHTLSCLQWTMRVSWFGEFKSQVSSWPNEDRTHIISDFPVIGDQFLAHRIMGSPESKHCEKIYGVILWEGEVTNVGALKFQVSVWLMR